MRSCTLLLLAAGFIGLNADPECPPYYNYVDAGSRKDCISVKSTYSFATAESLCRSDGGHLTSIHSAFENNLIIASAKRVRDSGRMWLGLKLPDPTSTTWSWQDGTSLDYENWGHIATSDQGLCASIDLTTGKWYATPCNTTLYSICAITFGCPSGWQYFSDTNQCYYAGTEGGSYKYARLYCQKTPGGDLASIHSEMEAQFVARKVAWHDCGEGPYGKKYGEALLGGVFWNGKISSWSDGSPVDYSYYVWRQHDGVLLTCAHDGGSGCGHCYNGDWYGPGYGTDSSEPYSSFICKTRPWGH